MAGRWPVALPNRHVQRMLDRDARLLILTRALPMGRTKPNIVEIHNSLVIRRNNRHRRDGRPDLQQNPHVLTIELLTIHEMALGDVDLKQARAAGYKLVADLHEDWRARYHRLDLERRVFLYWFEVSAARYLHRDVHRGYAHDPAAAVVGEGAALSAVHLERYSRAAADRDALIRDARRVEMPIEEEIRDLNRRARDGDREAQKAMFVIRQRVERARRLRARPAA